MQVENQGTSSSVRAFICLLCLFSTCAAQAQSSRGILAEPRSPLPTLFLAAMPAAIIPLAGAEEYYSVSGGLQVRCDYLLPFFPAGFVGGSLGYGLAPMLASNSVSLLALGAEAGIGWDILPWLTLEGRLSGGYYYSFLNTSSPFVGGGGPWAAAGISISVTVVPELRVSLGTALATYVGVHYNGLSVDLGVTVPLNGREPDYLVKAFAPPDKTREVLEIQSIETEPIFPILAKYYDEHPFGSITVRNPESSPVTGLTVRFLVKDFMDAPKECAAIESLPAGGSFSASLKALFNDRILTITEQTKIAAEIMIEYEFDSARRSQSRTETIRVMDRNAMTWDDDRKVAAFVTAKDPMILSFAKNLMSMTKGKASPALNEKIITTLAIHEALVLHGLVYTRDPAAVRGQAVDYLQFPRQTLLFKAGDCDDLSILYCALLESLGIECAFITVPDHIYMAASLAMTPEDARSAFSDAHAADLLFIDGQTWLPIEVTEREGDFLAAWRIGAREWRDNSLKGQARLLPIHEAWTQYEPAWLPGEEQPAMPETAVFLKRYIEAIARFVDGEISGQVKALEDQIRKSKANESHMNKLAVLYARYGMYDKAEAQLLSIVRTKSYVPALLNIGNIRYLKGDHEHALEYLERARAKEPANVKVLLALAQVNHAMENYGMATRLYQQVRDKDAALAGKFAYLGEKGEQGSRASEVAREKGAVAWSE